MSVSRNNQPLNPVLSMTSAEIKGMKEDLTCLNAVYRFESPDDLDAIFEASFLLEEEIDKTENCLIYQDFEQKFLDDGEVEVTIQFHTDREMDCIEKAEEVYESQ